MTDCVVTVRSVTVRAGRIPFGRPPSGRAPGFCLRAAPEGSPTQGPDKRKDAWELPFPGVFESLFRSASYWTLAFLMSSWKCCCTFWFARALRITGFWLSKEG